MYGSEPKTDMYIFTIIYQLESTLIYGRAGGGAGQIVKRSKFLLYMFGVPPKEYDTIELR